MLITGASGLLGNRLTALALARGHEVFSVFKEHAPQHGSSIRADITNEEQVKEAIRKARPQAVINTASLTDVDRCESEPDAAFLVNATAVRHLADGANQASAFFVQLSTDYVFDGEKGQYSEDDAPHPMSEYGKSKLEGERAVKSTGGDQWCIARTSVVYGWGRPHRPNAATYILDKLSREERVSMVTDQFSSPTLNTNLAEMVLEVAERRIHGILHTAGATRLSRYEFAHRLAEMMELTKSLISPVEASQLNWKAKRPKDSSLDVSRAVRVLTYGPLEVQDALRLFMNEKTSP